MSQMKVYDGASHVNPSSVKYWNGSEWVQAMPKRWTGSAWEELMSYLDDIFISGDYAAVMRIGAKTGLNVKWDSEYPGDYGAGSIYSSLSENKQNLYLLSVYSDILFKTDATNGAVTWSYNDPTNLTVQPISIAPDESFFIYDTSQAGFTKRSCSTGETISIYSLIEVQLRDYTVSPDGNYIYAGGRYGNVEKLTASGSSVWNNTYGTQDVYFIKARNNGKIYHNGHYDGGYKVVVLNDTGSFFKNLTADDGQKITSMDVSKNGDYVYCGNARDDVVSIDVATDTQEWKHVGVYLSRPTELEISDDGKYLYAMVERSIRQFDAVTGSVIWEVDASIDLGANSNVTLSSINV